MKTILIIHANPAVRRNLTTVLEMEGYAVLAAEHGNQGLEVTRTTTPDLIVCDATSPSFDALEVVKSLRKEPSTATVPVLLVTSKSQIPANPADPLTQSVNQDSLLASPTIALQMFNRP